VTGAGPARRATALALLLGLALVERAAPGAPYLVPGALAVVVLGGLPRPRRRRGWAALARDVLGALGWVLGAALALAVLGAVAVGGTSSDGLAAFGRLACLAGALALGRTPPPLLAAHALPVLLAVWSTAALSPRLDPVAVALTLATLGAGAHALALARSLMARSDAVGSLGTGVAPTARPLRLGPLPAAAIALAGLLPLAIGLSDPAPPRGGGQGGARRGGLRPAAEPSGPLAEPPRPRRVEFAPALETGRARTALDEDDAVVAVVWASPAPESLLLRGAALERATPDGFFPRRRSSADAPPIEHRRRRLLDVRLLRPQGGYLFATGWPQRVEVEGPGAAVDVGPAAVRVAGATYPLHYGAECHASHPGYVLDGLPAHPVPGLTDLPDLPSLAPDGPLAPLARSVAAAGESPHARARAVARWLGLRCRYDDAHPVPPGRDLGEAVAAFVLRERRGICAEFAAAMAVLLRLAGVPARVATGYRTSERLPDGGFVVRTRHAHAWVEVPIAGGGWVPYDPTPAAATPAGPTPTAAAAAGGPAPDGEAADAGVAAADAATAGPDADAALDRAPAAGPDDAPAPVDGWDLPALHPGWLLLAGLGAALAWWLGGRRRVRRLVLATVLGAGDAAPLPELGGERERLFRILEDRGYRLGRSETPTEFATARLGAPEDAPLREAVALYTEVRFGGRAGPGARGRLGALLDRAVRPRPGAARRSSASPGPG